MRLAVKVLSWITAVLFTFALLSVLFNGETIDSGTLLMAMLILVQSVMTLYYLHVTEYEIE